MSRAVKTSFLRMVGAACALRPIRKRVCFRGPRSCGQIALTFDDGPHEKYTEQVLEVLREVGVKATFFLLGRELEKRPRMAERIAAQKHEVGFHGFDHTPSSLGEQVRKCESLCFGAAATFSLFRPPAGRAPIGDVAWLLARGYTTVLWSFDTHDSMRHEGKWQEPPDYGRLAAGDIVLMHDDNPVCIEELRVLIGAADKMGLEPVTISELLGLRVRA